MTRISFNLRLVLYIFMCIVSFARRQLNQIAHPLRNEFLLSIDKCKINETLCDDVDNSIGLLAAKLANEHSALMIIHEAQSVFKAAVQSIPKDRSIYFRLIHILCVLAFSNGDLIEVIFSILFYVFVDNLGFIGTILLGPIKSQRTRLKAQPRSSSTDRWK